jgi:transposase
MSEQNPDPKTTHGAASKATRRYSEPFKADAVRLVTHERYSFAKAAKAVGVSEKSLRDWHRRLAPRAASNANPDADDAMQAENRRLREALRQAEMERDILKKAARFFANDTNDASPSSRSKR